MFPTVTTTTFCPRPSKPVECSNPDATRIKTMNNYLSDRARNGINAMHDHFATETIPIVAPHTQPAFRAASMMMTPPEQFVGDFQPAVVYGEGVEHFDAPLPVVYAEQAPAFPLESDFAHGDTIVVESPPVAGMYQQQPGMYAQPQGMPRAGSRPSSRPPSRPNTPPAVIPALFDAHCERDALRERAEAAAAEAATLNPADGWTENRGAPYAMPQPQAFGQQQMQQQQPPMQQYASYAPPDDRGAGYVGAYAPPTELSMVPGAQQVDFNTLGHGRSISEPLGTIAPPGGMGMPPPMPSYMGRATDRGSRPGSRMSSPSTLSGSQAMA